MIKCFGIRQYGVLIVKLVMNFMQQNSMRDFIIKLSPCLIKPHAMMMYRRMEVQLHALLILALDESEWSASCHNHFTPCKEPPQYPLDRRLGGPQSWYKHNTEVKILLTLLGIKSRSPSCPANNLVAILNKLSSLQQ
jgi:hypothetical protein